MSLMTTVPPALVFLVAAVIATVDRRVAGVIGVVVSLAALPWVLTVTGGAHLSIRAFGSTPFGFDVVLFAVDPFSRAVGAVFALVAVANVLYVYGTGRSAREMATALAYIGASLGAIFAGDWLTLVVWWELMAVAATVLLWQSVDSVRAGYRYAVYHQLGGVALVAGVFLQYARTGTFLMGDGIVSGVPLLLVVLGVGMNAGFLGMHVWIVDAYPRPAVATTVVLSGFTTKVGVYTLVRALPGQSLAVAYLGGAMVLAGVTMAVLQTDMRRLLSYHIVSQVGYMVAGIGLGTAAGAAGGVAHLVNNVLYKTLLFMVAGIIVLETGRESLKKLGGLGRRLPAAAVAFAVAAFAITGIPGFSGFVSKGFVTSATTAAGADLLWWALQIGAVGTVVSFAKFGYYAFLRSAPDDGADERASGAAVLGTEPAIAVALGLLAVPCLVFGLMPGLLVALLPGGVSTSSVFSISKLTDGAVITIAGVGIFALIRRPLVRVTAVPDLDRLYHPAGRLVHDGLSRTVANGGGRLQQAAFRMVDESNAVLSAPERLEEVGLGRSSIGTGVLLLALVAALAIVILSWPG